MASLKLGHRAFRIIYNQISPLITNSRRFRAKSFIQYSIRRCGSLFTATALLQRIKTDDEKETEDVKAFGTDQMIRNTCVATINAATSLLTVVIADLLDIEKQYSKALDTLIQLQEYNLHVLGDQVKEEQIWDTMLQTRVEVNTLKQRQQALEELFRCSERTLRAAAESAHSAGLEYIAIAASERVQSAISEIERAQRKSKQTEQELVTIELKTIEKTVEFANVSKAQTQAEEKSPQTEQS